MKIGMSNENVAFQTSCRGFVTFLCIEDIMYKHYFMHEKHVIRNLFLLNALTLISLLPSILPVFYEDMDVYYF